MKQQIDIAQIDVSEDIDQLISNNKQRIKLLSEINAELNSRKIYQNKYKLLQKEVDNLEQELKNTREKTTKSWEEKLESEQEITVNLQRELEKLRQELAANSDTPGYQQAIKHVAFHDKAQKPDIPSTRANYKNTANRLQQEIKKLQQQVNERKLDLIDEIKKKTDLEKTIRHQRAVISRLKKNDSSTRFTTSVPDLSLC